MNTALEELAKTASTCTRCRLSAGRTQVVFADGSPDADLMFIGEGPGYHEDVQGLPFVGAAGQLLNTLLKDVSLRREDVYIANVVKCLKYNAQVQLGDGSWERIGRLVRSRYDGLVMAVDDAGHLVRRRVIGWHATPLAGRRVFSLRYRSLKAAGRRKAGIRLTGDHPVLTKRGWIAVQELLPEDRIATGQGLSSAAWDAVCGTVLGDGHIERRSSALSFSHAERHAEYADFKVRLLAELAPRREARTVALTADGSDRRVVMVRTLAHRALRTLREDFYKPKKVVPHWMPEALNARMLAFWFMDDGYTRIRPTRNPLAEIATNCFSDVDLQLLIAGLLRLGLPAKALRGRLYFDVPATKRLSELIAPYVPSVMRYKLHPEVARRVPFDFSRFATSAAKTLFDHVEIKDVTEQEQEFRKNPTYFCIDVEDTHNFVTSAGVVHNCRPPGNRDPLPDEIESCRPYLTQQIELVDPKVIVTLGNFATRVILDRPVAISRVRGQRFPLGGRLVIPTFHPAAVLRGGGAASRTMEQVREDFATIRAALDEASSAGAAVVPEEQLGLF